MGVFKVTIQIGDPGGERFESVAALVDTGASHTTAPASLLNRLGVDPHARSRFELADGSIQEFDVGLTWVRVDGETTITSIVFAPEGAESVLGAITMEQLLLAPDPVRRQLVPVPGLLK
ncbi:MAG: retroviral-like aspartic protease family protein [Chloroflexi bacterium]|nr:retroviral-like aspartic protease family protein [Chloroflexota bacterium]